MQPLDTGTRVLLVVIGLAGFLAASQLRFEPDRFICALVASFFLLLPIFDVILWWGSR